MRQVLRGLAIAMLVFPAARAGAQQGSVQLSAAAQALTGDPSRLGGQRSLEPDFGVRWIQPGSRFGTFQIELRGTNRGGLPHLGRMQAVLRDLKYRGVSWTFDAGDTYVAPAIGDYRFSNLFTPAVTFSGAAVSGRTTNTTFAVVAGRTTAWRNIFGSDPDTLEQTLQLASVTHKISPLLQVQARASHVRTEDLKEFEFSIASSHQAGGGATFLLTPAIHLIADGSVVSYRRKDSEETTHDGSFLAGTSWLLARGWLQLNVSRFSPGDFPVLTYPLQDREGFFAAGEYDVLPRLRLFGGLDSFRGNLRPADLTVSSPIPLTDGKRTFGGFRFALWPQSAVTLRIEDGDRVSRPVRAGFGAATDSDTGSWSAEWQAIFGRATTFTRYSRRENVDRSNVAGSFTQHDASAHVFVTLSRAVQLFGLGMLTETGMAQGAGNKYWQAGGGTQVQVPRRNLWVRAEATVSRNIDLLTDAFVPRESVSVGLNGQLTRQMTVGFDVYVDRAPQPAASGSPWLTRSMLRVTHTVSTGTARAVERGIGGTTPARTAGTGSILGNVFADWNANGALDPDEGPLQGIPVRVSAVADAMTGANGQFTFLSVPAGAQEVGLDTAALPIDFDAPPQPSVRVELARGETERVAFGLVPLGSIAGRVVRDANANAAADPGEESIDGAIVILDGGARSEQTRRGRFKFDAVRSGEHTVQLLVESLGEGAKTTGPATLRVPLTREQLAAEVTFLVSIEKRPEIRRVFPSKVGAVTAPPAFVPPRTGSADRPAQPPMTPPRSPSAPVAHARQDVSREPKASTTKSAATYAVQIAAVRDGGRARALVKSLQSAGYPAYVLEPAAPDVLFRIRVGTYPTHDAAEHARKRLERERGEKGWVTREVTAR